MESCEERYFGSLSSSILTLYSSMSGGEDWTVPLSLKDRASFRALV